MTYGDLVLATGEGMNMVSYTDTFTIQSLQMSLEHCFLIHKLIH